ncbi:agmatinase [Enterovibrio norvegicus]|uniref:Agmatinase n=2 Tax=Enterovibrio norvegicus TaxID=188144 RepID=A0A1I5K8Q3_9GAMM|nr:agmatinase [Enterovibrio norvegicus]MCC4798108.1 agmatinase [Enterovibrio norvegicus]OEF51713.1 agmatinase [Enterovibrio norvegicus]OEF55884.1 agmatinase [Enterovibrio norvegicus]PMH72109.1 agmatinase [Enterovibrio norvegicus]PMI38044.1 agmatinase [Enterovibrio norvegicus]
MENIFDRKDDSLYSNAYSFLRLPMVQDPTKVNADVVVLGMPYDMATTGRSGARLGPDAVRRASVNLAWEGHRYPWPFDLRERCNIVDAGDLIFACGDSEDFCNTAASAASKILASGKTLLSLGGDHFITLPLLRAHHDKHGVMALIHFDAHTDTYSQGSRYDHGTMFYHAPKEGLIDANKSVQIGIRTDYEKDGHGFNVICAEAANDMTPDDIAIHIKAIVGDMPVYITFDIDCLDPAHAPGTGTPVVGGITSDKALRILRGLLGINLVGMDVVEVSPPFDNSEITALAGATIATELLHLWASSQH